MRYSSNPPLVSVRLMTYNQAPFIAEAIESCLMQKTDFDFEIVIGDDFSTDGTREICEMYEKNSKKIKLLDRKEGDEYWRKRQKLGRLYNFTNIIENCNGKYITLLDGDDYWKDPQKLQKQVNILEKNQEIICCHHWQKYAITKGNGYDEIEAPIVGHGYLDQEVATVEEIFENKLRVKSRTMMFRNIFSVDFFPDWFYQVAFGDVPLNYLLGKHGKFYFINESMAVYRQTGNGVSTEGNENYIYIYNHYLEWIKVWEYSLKHYNYQYQGEANRTILSFYYFIIKHYNSDNRIFINLLNYSIFQSKLFKSKRLAIFYPLIKLYFRNKILYFKIKVHKMLFQHA